MEWCKGTLGEWECTRTPDRVFSWDGLSYNWIGNEPVDEVEQQWCKIQRWRMSWGRWEPADPCLQSGWRSRCRRQSWSLRRGVSTTGRSWSGDPTSWRCKRRQRRQRGLGWRSGCWCLSCWRRGRRHRRAWEQCCLVRWRLRREGKLDRRCRSKRCRRWLLPPEDRRIPVTSWLTATENAFWEPVCNLPPNQWCWAGWRASTFSSGCKTPWIPDNSSRNRKVFKALKNTWPTSCHLFLSYRQSD